MECEIRKARYLSEISTVTELREARRELELREWFARQRLVEDAEDIFSIGNLLSIVAPPGSMVDRVIGGAGTGFTAVHGVLGVIGSLLGGRTARSKPAARSVHRPSAGRTTRKSATPAAAGRKPAARKRSPELEIEVELEPAPVRAPRGRGRSKS